MLSSLQRISTARGGRDDYDCDDDYDYYDDGGNGNTNTPHSDLWSPSFLGPRGPLRVIPSTRPPVRRLQSFY